MTKINQINDFFKFFNNLLTLTNTLIHNQQRNDVCLYNSSTPYATISTSHPVTYFPINDTCGMMNSLANGSILTAALRLSDQFWHLKYIINSHFKRTSDVICVFFFFFCRNGIYDGPNDREHCPSTNESGHAVALVGYGTSKKGIKYWVPINKLFEKMCRK